MIFLVATTMAVLPPGYEDELFCPPQTCLASREVRPGLSGPRPMFYQCCNESTGVHITPKAWGNKLSLSYRESLINEGWHELECPEGVCQTDTRTLSARIETIVDRILLNIF